LRAIDVNPFKAKENVSWSQFMALWGMVLTNKSHLPEKVDFIEKIFNPERKE